MRLKIVLLYVAVLLACACGTKKKSTEKVSVKDSVTYALPFNAELSLASLCDTPTYFKAESGPVRTEIQYVKGEPVLRVEYDTIYKERIRYVDKIKTEEVVRWKLDWRWIVASFAGGLLIGLIGRKWLL